MLLNKKEAAKYLNISVETLDKYKDGHKLSFVKIGDRCFWTVTLLDEFINSCIIPATYTPTNRERLEVTKRAQEGAA